VENNEQFTRTSLLRSGQKAVIFNQLLRASMSMHHIDEFLNWLAYKIVQDLNVQVIQFWANETPYRNQVSVLLRATACQDISLPQYVILNATITEVIGQLLSEQRGAELQPVQSTFSAHLSNLFRRYGLNYWLGYFLRSDALIPSPANDRYSDIDTTTPCVMLASMFLRQFPSQSLLPTAIAILEQVVPTAIQSQLLIVPAADFDIKPMMSENVQQQQSLSVMDEIIPHRVRDKEAMRSRSPFTSTPVIPEREARRLYLVIDDRKNLVELTSITQLNMKDLYMALRILLTQNYIQLYTKAGQLIDSSWFLENLGVSI
jgi:hypothetical protein